LAVTEGARGRATASTSAGHLAMAWQIRATVSSRIAMALRVEPAEASRRRASKDACLSTE